MTKITPPFKEAEQLKIMKWLLIYVTIFLIVLTLIAGGALIYEKTYRYSFFPGVKIAGLALLGQTHAQAVEAWQSKVDRFSAEGIKYLFNGKKVVITPTVAATDPDISYRLVDFNVLSTVDQAYLTGRQKGYTANFFAQMKALLKGEDFKLIFTINEDNFKSALKNNFAELTRKKQDARPLIDNDLNITIAGEQSGTTFAYEAILEQTKQQLAVLNNQPIKLELQEDEPQIKQSEIGNAEAEKIKRALTKEKLVLSYNNQKSLAEGSEKTWEIERTIFKDWLIFKRYAESKEINAAFDEESLSRYLKENIAKEIDRPALDAKFSINNGRVSEFQGSQDGIALEIEQTIERINNEFFNESAGPVAIITTETKSTVAVASVNDMGIRAIIGTGFTNYKGSPKNRRHNIKVGADALNGLLIKPGETFSLTAALGQVNASQGYLPELVIKGDRTIPEYGGGLCQVATTLFRAVLASGLPVVERKEHAYRVMYYEPAGKDATIYIPKPDLKFTNDTGNYILIQSRIEGDNLYFDFWGAGDGRIAEQSDSTIYNIKPAGATIYIETEELKPGEKKCIETAHAGADAYFDYKVTYPGGEKKEVRFTSHYVPWPAKCLIGKQPAPPNENSATATPTGVQ